MNCIKDFPKCPCGPGVKDAGCPFRKVVIPAVMGTDEEGEPHAPENGQYQNALVEYEANGHVYIYSADGIFTKLPVLREGEIGDYATLSNKPRINGIVLNGDKSLDSLGIIQDKDYAHLDNLPSINGVELTGNKTSEQLHLSSGKVFNARQYARNEDITVNDWEVSYNAEFTGTLEDLRALMDGDTCIVFNWEEPGKSGGVTEKKSVVLSNSGSSTEDDDSFYCVWHSAYMEDLTRRTASYDYELTFDYNKNSGECTIRFDSMPEEASSSVGAFNIDAYNTPSLVTREYNEATKPMLVSASGTFREEFVYDGVEKTIRRVADRGITVSYHYDVRYRHPGETIQFTGFSNRVLSQDQSHSDFMWYTVLPFTSESGEKSLKEYTLHIYYSADDSLWHYEIARED